MVSVSGEPAGPERVKRLVVPAGVHVSSVGDNPSGSIPGPTPNFVHR